MSPAARVLSVLGGLFLTAAIASAVTLDQPAWGPVLLVLAATIGPVMGLAAPFAVGVRVAYVGGLLFAVALLVGGGRRFGHLAGQAAVVAGVTLWVLLGLIGVGTGT